MEGGKKATVAKKTAKKAPSPQQNSAQDSTATKKLKSTMTQKLQKEYPCYEKLSESEQKKLLRYFTKFYQAFLAGNSKGMNSVTDAAPKKLIKKGKCI